MGLFNFLKMATISAGNLNFQFLISTKPLQSENETRGPVDSGRPPEGESIGKFSVNSDNGAEGKRLRYLADVNQ